MTRKQLVVAGLVALALLARAVHLFALHGEPIMEFHRVYAASDMYLFDQWAQRIAAGDWLGREVYHPLAQWQLDAAPLEKWERWYGTTPVFYKAPFYAYLIALLQLAFGDAMVPMAWLQAIVSALSVAVLVLLTERTLGWEPAVCAGLLLALYAPDIHYDAVMLRGPWIVLASLVVTWQLLRLREVPSAARAVLLGASIGLALLVNEGFSILVVLVLPVLPWRRGRGLPMAAGLLGGLLLALLPLVVRNLVVGSPPLSVAVTGSTVYAVFNAAGANPFFFEVRHPNVVPVLDRAGGSLLGTAVACLQTFDGVGDAVALYLGKLAALVVPFEGPDNFNFYYAALASPLLRELPAYGVVFALAAVGLALALRPPRRREVLVWVPVGLALLAALLMTQPVSRYRAVFTVFLLPFAGLAVAALVAELRARRWLRAAALAGAVLAVGGGALLLEREVVFRRQPRDAFRYRSAEFILSARVHSGRGDLASAARELLLLARLNPRLSDRINAYLMLAELAVHGGKEQVARAALATAARLGHADGFALLAVGDAYGALLRDRAAARASYEAARRADRAGLLQDVLRRRLGSLDARGGP